MRHPFLSRSASFGLAAFRSATSYFRWPSVNPSLGNAAGRLAMAYALAAVIAIGAPGPLPSLHAAADEGDGSKVRFERWYSMLIQGQPSGWMHSIERRKGNRFITENRSVISVKRGPTQLLTLEMETKFVETVEGKPVRASSTQDLGLMAISRELIFKDGKVEIKSSQRGQQQTRAVDLEGDWLPPVAAHREALNKMKAGADSFSIKTMDPSMGTSLVTLDFKRVGEEAIEVLGRVVPATAWRVENSLMPGAPGMQYVDENGRMLKTTMEMMPGMEIKVVAADKELAKKEVNPPELLMDTLIHPKGEIASPREKQRGVYKLTFTGERNDGKGSSRFPIPETGYQSVEWISERSAKVTVDLNQRDPKTDAEPPTKEARQASTMMNSEDPQIERLVTKALENKDRGSMSKREIAEALRRFANDYIREKDLSVGFGSATEVAETKQGDCTEHAVFLGALLRAADIPSRVVSGLIFVEHFQGKSGVFGYHMWTQAWLKGQGKQEGQWVDLDPTLRDHAFDATHIALQGSALGGDIIPNDMVEMASLFGRLEINVIE